MQRLLIAILAALLIVSPTLAPQAWAEDDETGPPQKDLLRDTQQCTEVANTKVLETDGDAEALFVECMTQRGYTEDELDELEDQ